MTQAMLRKECIVRGCRRSAESEGRYDAAGAYIAASAVLAVRPPDNFPHCA